MNREDRIQALEKEITDIYLILLCFILVLLLVGLWLFLVSNQVSDIIITDMIGEPYK